MSNDGTGLRERLKLAANTLDPPLSSEWRPFSDKANAALLREAAAALSAVAPPVATAERIADSLMMDAVTDKWSGRDAIVAAVRKALAASPAAPAQPEGGDAVDAPPIPAWLIDACQSRVWAAAWEMSAKIARPAPARQAVTDGVEVVRIDRSERLDPITVYFADEGGGRGRMTIVCYNQAWTCYWGAMGNRTLREFVARCDASYVSGNMLSGLVSEDSDFAYAERVAEAVIAALTSNAAASAADAQEEK